jgi:hypothetical protein
MHMHDIGDDGGGWVQIIAHSYAKIRVAMPLE